MRFRATLRSSWMATVAGPSSASAACGRPQRGVEMVREVVKACVARGVEYLTLFAFSSENWRRPAEEVSMLKQLFIMALEREAEKLHRNGIRLRVVGDIAPFGKRSPTWWRAPSS